jgi:hypothetical protein
MKNVKINQATCLLAVLSLSLFISCDQKKEKKHKKKDKQEETGDAPSVQRGKDLVNTDPSACDPTIWKYVYNPTRLEVIDQCKTVIGVIEESSADDDGDQHMLLKLDAGQDNLLKKKNIKKKNGDLVIEAVCMNNITNPKVGGACDGYINLVQLPKLGDHVKVSGSYVIDSHNGWTEIHPITKIEIIK